MLDNINPATLHLLKKLITDACDGRRDELGDAGGEYTIHETLTLKVKGTLKVEPSCEDAIIAQKAQPWSLLVAAMDLANRHLTAAGAAGIDLRKVVELAEKADPKVVKQAKKETAEALRAIKEQVRGFRRGRVLASGQAQTVNLLPQLREFRNSKVG